MNISTIRTPWTDILAAQHGDPAFRARCLEEIAEKYYNPVRAYISALPGVNRPEDVDDLVQGFFHKFLEKEILNRLDRDKGRFRQFLKTAVRNFVKDEAKKASRDDPRSPLMRHHSLPAGEIMLSDCKPLTPDEEFDRSWTRELVNDALAAFKADCFDHHKENYYAVFERHILSPDAFGNPSYAVTAAALGMSEKAVSNNRDRARKRFQALLLEMSGVTVEDKTDAERELAELRRYF